MVTNEDVDKVVVGPSARGVVHRLRTASVVVVAAAAAAWTARMMHGVGEHEWRRRAAVRAAFGPAQVELGVCERRQPFRALHWQLRATMPTGPSARGCGAGGSASGANSGAGLLQQQHWRRRWRCCCIGGGKGSSSGRAN